MSEQHQVYGFRCCRSFLIQFYQPLMNLPAASGGELTHRDSNPVPKEAVREGIIDNPRDPERFIFNYCAKSILSGIKSSIVKSPKK